MPAEPTTPPGGAAADDAGADRTEAEFAAGLGRRLDEVLAGQAERAREISDSATPMIEAIAALVTGGKRLRPRLAWWGWRGAGGAAGSDVIVTAGAALELFQAAALIHDDILDRSDTRRGAPSVHRRFQAHHREAGWRQDGAHFGVSAAILTGDLSLAMSEELFAAAADATSRPARARQRFNQMRFEVMTGQYLDVLDEVDVPGGRAGRTGDEAAGQGSASQRPVSQRPASQEPAGQELAGRIPSGTAEVTADPAAALRRARTVLTYKSARYSTVHPLALGGLLAGAPEELITAYDAVSTPLGAAFQLQDDLLGVFGDPSVTGKPAGDDLREGKRTELVAHALQRLLAAGQSARAAQLDAALGDPGLDAAGVARLQETLESCGARARVEQDIAGLGAEALTALAELPVEPTVRAGLERLVRRLTDRLS